MSVRSLALAAAASLALAAPPAAHAGPLSIGDPAPPLTVSRWVKGEKFDRLEPDQTYVVEFWATWCGPCRTSIPHLTELQHKYKDKGIKFIGVSIWEQDQDKVAPFVKEMGDKMDYSVALDEVPDGENGQTGKMALSWMKAAEENGIPTAFIVKDGKVAWIGHPMGMDEPLSEVASGNFDVSAAASKHREEKATQKKLMDVVTRLRKLGANADSGEQIAVLDEVMKAEPKLARYFGAMKFQLLLKADRDAATGYATGLVEKATKDDVELLNTIAWRYVDPDAPTKPSRDEVALALRAAEKANGFAGGKNGALLDTLARAYFVSGQPARALECQEKAVSLMGEAADQNGVKDRLEQYRKAVKDQDRNP